VHHAIERFTGHALRAEDVKQLIDSPSNVINVQTDAKQSMNLKLAWGIEARLVSNEVRVVGLLVCDGVDSDPDMTLIVEVLFPCRSTYTMCYSSRRRRRNRIWKGKWRGYN
jgi:hypothetical protein